MNFNKKLTMSYFQELNKFLKQVKTNDLQTSDYLKIYQDLTVKVGFGMGNPARIPWIAFLNEKNTVQNGIYPVYLFFKNRNFLILSYGISETNKPSSNWNVLNGITIKQYFENNNLGKPDRYGSSLIFKVYHTNQPLSEEIINRDLNEIIEEYKKLYLMPNLTPNSLEPNSYLIGQLEYTKLINDLTISGLFYNDKIFLRFISSLLSKPFVILTGLSGSGKTKLAQAFAMWICEDESQYCLVPVGADWTNREPLLGFPNALETGKYIKPDNRALDLIIEASKEENQQKPYFLILDEMNLSHVERYFADFLSVMESRTQIPLHSGDGEWDGVPAKIKLPANFFIVGTVNIDETTYMFSPKVLDRANVIEFRVTREEMNSYLEKSSYIDLQNLTGKGKEMALNFLEIAIKKDLLPRDQTSFSTELIKFFSELKKSGAEFGYRSASEILRFAAVVNVIEPDWKVSDIIDAAVMQKLLPKVHGSQRKLGPVLKTLGSLCLQDGQKIDDFLNPKTEIDYSDSLKIRYPVSFEKILRMYDNLISNGFTSYAEA